MARQRRVDPGRDLLDLMAAHAQDSAKQTLPQLDTGTVIVVNDGTDGTVVQLDNMSVAASDCLTLGGYVPVVGDRVMVLVNQEEFWIIGGVSGQSTGASSPPSGPAGGDLAGTYPSPTIKASVGLTGAPTAPTASPGTSTTQLASTAFVGAAGALKADLASPTFTGDPKAPTPAIGDSDTSIATTSFVYGAISDVLQAGTIVMYGSASPPPGWLLCDGSAVARVGTFGALFAAISTGFGVGDGSTTFNIPNLKGRFPVGFDSGQTEFNATGKTGGAKSNTATHLHTHTGTHTHPLSDNGQARIFIQATAAPNLIMRRVTTGSWTANLQGDATTVASNTGSQTAGAGLDGTTDAAAPGSTDNASPVVPTLPPYITVYFMIKY